MRIFSFNGYIGNHSRLSRRCRPVWNGFVPCHSRFHTTTVQSPKPYCNEFTQHWRTCFCISPTPFCLLYQDTARHSPYCLCSAKPTSPLTRRRGKTMLPSWFIFQTYRLTTFYLIAFHFFPCPGHFLHHLPFYFPQIHRRNT